MYTKFKKSRTDAKPRGPARTGTDAAPTNLSSANGSAGKPSRHKLLCMGTVLRWLTDHKEKDPEETPDLNEVVPKPADVVVPDPPPVSTVRASRIPAAARLNGPRAVAVTERSLSAGDRSDSPTAVAIRRTPSPVPAGTGSARSRRTGSARSRRSTNAASPPPAEVPSEPKVDCIKVVNVDLKKHYNRFLHNSHQYELQWLIVRRGQEFSIKVEFDRPFDKDTDGICLRLFNGRAPKRSKGSLIILKPSDKIQSTEWGMAIDDIEKNEVTLKVMPASDAIVGPYNFEVITNLTQDGKQVMRHIHKEEDSICILFNAWCKDDAVYMKDEDDRREYVLNETGRIYTGAAWRIRGKPWNFGQFESVSLITALHLLYNNYLENLDQARSNPILTTRVLSAMCNSNDDDGVLSGNWSGKYEPHTRPTEWNGSPEIFEEYLNTGQDVKWGQCWVFSGILTTVCRAIGIPTRSVTNFKSAHDTDSSLTIDKFLDEEGEKYHGLPNDSVWNFHVWNEAWFKRPDLPKGNDGWQAFDSTPQEASGDIMQCGPAPLAAIKSGNVYLSYDARFIFAEVNGDRLKWMVDKEGDITLIKKTKGDVGHNISTKAVGSNKREDVTHLYKHPDGTEEEREALEHAMEYSARRRFFAEEGVYDSREDDKVLFEVGGDINPKTGDLEMTIEITNNMKEVADVTMKLHATATYYTGEDGDRLDHQKLTEQVPPGKAQTVNWTLPASSYINDLEEDAQLSVYFMAKVKDTDIIYATTRTFLVDKPDLQMVCPHEVNVGEDFEVTISLENPLPVALKQGVIRLEGPGCKKKVILKLKEEVAAHGTLTKSFTLTPKYPGHRELVASFNCKQLTDITGTCLVEVIGENSTSG